MAIDIQPYRVKEGDKIDLSDLPTRVAPVYKSKKNYKKLLKRNARRLSKIQERFYADDTYSLLIIFQAMDAAGKDSSIRHVMSGVNPQGCQVYSFKHPSATELDHDFLWRTVACLPERGRIGIFNRSYYEEVLIVRVHPAILEGQNLPEEIEEGRNIWRQRFESIREHEKHLHRNGTRVIKFFLHISQEEQARRFIDRIDEPKKRWKFSAGDVHERDHWDEYMQAYEDAISATSTEHAPWYVIPADDKRTAHLLVSTVILRTMKELGLEYPEMAVERLADLQAFRSQLAATLPDDDEEDEDDDDSGEEESESSDELAEAAVESEPGYDEAASGDEALGRDGVKVEELPVQEPD